MFVTLTLCKGLSPPTRGNPSGRAFLFATKRSIPAHAGEPQLYAGEAQGYEVYPRPRGGTAVLRPRDADIRGLSAPTRGNPPT